MDQVLHILTDEAEDLGSLELISVKEAAAFCHCSEDKVLRWIHGNKLRAWNIGDGARACLRVAKQDLIKLLQGRLVTQVQVAKKARRRGFRSPYLEQRRTRAGTTNNRGACGPRS